MTGIRSQRSMKRGPCQPLFAVSYGSFLGRRLHEKTLNRFASEGFCVTGCYANQSTGSDVLPCNCGKKGTERDRQVTRFWIGDLLLHALRSSHNQQMNSPFRSFCPVLPSPQFGVDGTPKPPALSCKDWFLLSARWNAARQSPGAQHGSEA